VHRSRIDCDNLRRKVMSAEDAAALIKPHDAIGMSGFTGSGYPKAVPLALAARIEAEHAAGNPFQVRIWTGASTGPELDGALAKANGIEYRLPYNSDPDVRDRINRGDMEYFDMHLSQVAPMAWQGFLGPLDAAVIEVTGVRPDGKLIPSSSVGNNKTWLERAQKVIPEVNARQNEALEGMHDIYYGTALPPNRVPIPLTRPDDRIGERYFHVDPDKIVAVVETHAPDRNLPFSPPDAVAAAIPGNLMEFFRHEVTKKRLPAALLPSQSGIGNIPNTVLGELVDGPFENLTAYTEVIQDGMLKLIAAGKIHFASATAFSLSPNAAGNFDVVLPRLGRHDEIGDIAAAVEAFKVKAIEKAHIESEQDAERRRQETDEAARRQRAELELAAKAAEDRGGAIPCRAPAGGRPQESRLGRPDVPPERRFLGDLSTNQN
jgi:succinyl-CoA:acetate CoA-transferase